MSTLSDGLAEHFDEIARRLRCIGRALSPPKGDPVDDFIRAHWSFCGGLGWRSTERGGTSAKNATLEARVAPPPVELTPVEQALVKNAAFSSSSEVQGLLAIIDRLTGREA